MRAAQPKATPLPPTAQGALALLSRPLREWFLSHYSKPTPAQRKAWPILLSGGSLLLSAPTGSGKTWAALIPLVQRWLAAPRRQRRLRCIYIAPLRALCNDLYFRIGEAFGELGDGAAV